MRATEILMSEHRVIEQVLDCLEKLARQNLQQGRLDGESAHQILDFFRDFADRCHHGKEEQCLFPMMESRGFPRNGGPTGVMLHEHQEGREFIRGMAAAVDRAMHGDPRAVQEFSTHALGYCEMLRQHIWKEDQRLFPMADSTLSDEDQAVLLARFDDIEHHDLGDGTHEHYLKIAQELASRFGLPNSDVAAKTCHGCGCGHKTTP